MPRLPAVRLKLRAARPMRAESVFHCDKTMNPSSDLPHPFRRFNLLSLAGLPTPMTVLPKLRAARCGRNLFIPETEC